MDKTPKELEPLIFDAISELLQSSKYNFTGRDYWDYPLNHKEKLYLITTLHEELSSPELPPGLIYLYGKILFWVKENILYN